MSTKFVIKPTQLAVATYLMEHGPATVSEISTHTELTKPGVKKAILVMRKQNLIESVRSMNSRERIRYRWVA